MPPEVLDARALNRALLQRQGLLARSDTPAVEMIERLVGMQAQVPENPYVALWSRVHDFRAEQLSGLIAARRAVRAQLMRSTIHLVSARDCLAFHPITLPILARVFRSPWASGLRGASLDEVVDAGVDLIAAGPRTRAELAGLLAPRWPDADPRALAHAVTFNCALVQVPPRGLWGAGGQATWALAETWLGEDLHSDPSPNDLVLRYLTAFGPATVSDVRTWSGLTGLRAVVDRLRPRLRAFRDEQGRELLDVPDVPLPDPGTPAPPRFLPEYDNVALSHADRSRIFSGLGPGLPFPHGRWIGSLLYEGFYRANWEITEAGGSAVLTVDRFTRHPSDPSSDAVDEIAGEGMRLLAFVAPDAAEREVRFVPEP